jgi:hypothetical protein
VIEPFGNRVKAPSICDGRTLYERRKPDLTDEIGKTNPCRRQE